MNRPMCLRLLRAGAVLWLALAAWCAGQNTEAAREPLPVLPVNGLLDEGKVFPEAEAALIAADIADFRTRTGLPLYLVTANYIAGDTVDHFGERLVREGLKDRSGVVIVYERGSNKLSYTATPGAMGRAEDMQKLFLFSTKAAAALPPEAANSRRLRVAVQSLTAACEQWRKTGVPPDMEPGSAPLPAAPPDFVRDDGDIFAVEAEAAVKAELRKFHAQHNIGIYIVTGVLPPGTAAQEWSERLAADWLRDRMGAVLVINRSAAADGEGPGIASAAKNEAAVPRAEILQMLQRARAAARDAGMHAAARLIMQTLAPRATAAPAITGAPGRLNLMSGVAAALLAGAALLFAYHCFKERIGGRSTDKIYFPDVTVGRRLGAPHGGGKVAGISFARKE